MKHTPLPWEFSPSSHLIYPARLGSQMPIGSVNRQYRNSLENAEYIVTACNAYPDLVEALREISELSVDGGASKYDLGMLASKALTKAEEVGL